MRGMFPGQLFELGETVITPGALEALGEAGQSSLEYVVRHARGDWGTISKDDATENELSLHQGFRIMSVYPLPTKVTIWIITEADRSVTTILLPSEY